MDLSRRRFNQIVTALGFRSGLRAFAAEASGSGGGTAAPEPEILRLERNGWMPNNPYLPALFYRSALAAKGSDAALACEALFTRNGFESPVMRERSVRTLARSSAVMRSPL